MRLNRSGQATAAIAGILVFFIISIIAGFCWQYSINHWLAYAGKAQRIAFWQACLMGFVPYLGQFSIVVAVVTWILSLFL